MSLFTDLTQRGLIHQTTDPRLPQLVDGPPLTVYCGFDPTAESLHVGHLQMILALRRFQKAGHRILAVVGGATGMIGDPSGRTQERQLLDGPTLEKNVDGLRRQLGRLLDFSSPTRGLLINNYDWTHGLSVIDYLRDIGKHFSVNMMLAKESVRARLEDRDHGISYTEFSYMILQSYDFLHLFDKEGCTLQIGGSDQWGNIVAGVDLIRRLRGKEAFGCTFPLIAKSDGTKFGKTEKGAVWLDPQRTSPYEFYQFFLQTDDQDVLKFLNYFTDLSEGDRAGLAERVQSSPEKREAQRRLASFMTELVHGPDARQQAETAASALFTGGLRSLSTTQLKEALKEAPKTSIEKQTLLSQGLPLLDALVLTQLCASKGAARKDVTGGGIYLNDERVDDVGLTLKEEHLLDGSLIVLRKGKKNYHILEMK